MASNQQTPVNTATEESQKDAAARRAKGEFVRGRSGFRDYIGTDEFPAEPNRYHIFVAFNCPWCHRVTLARSVLGLQDAITMDVAFPNRTTEGDPIEPNRWEFNPSRIATLTGTTLPECTEETATGKKLRLAKQIYELEGSSEASVPILFDKKTQRIVSNESAEIIRMLDQHATALGSTIPATERVSLYPRGEDASSEKLRAAIEEVNELTYTKINNGAYKAGFAEAQEYYGPAFQAYFEALDTLEEKLKAQDSPFLTGDTFTEADLRLFPTLYRHDPVYYVRFKLNGAKIVDYPRLWRWLCRVYALPGVAASNSLIHCRQGYFGRSWNNTVPLGPLKPMPYPEAYNHPELAPPL